MRLEEPEEVNPNWKVWSLDVLKPAKGLYDWRPDEGGGKVDRLKVIRTALSSASRVIIATDNDREGQAIGESLVFAILPLKAMSFAPCSRRKIQSPSMRRSPT